MLMKIDNVKREVFDSVSDKIKLDEVLYNEVSIRYNGTNLRGTIEIEALTERRFNRAFRVFYDVYMDY